ncbi:MAG: helix-turn-helix domain-containing protein [Anaerotignum propionicum]|uniref:helix-turn-helix domain-containing protein n=1 Tax=Anaerotignum propionicum TaxID=28446 RepID=UPI002B20527A|nr:helix-turn-helix domain-containing protein [Anaerotignum propionicum]MEA5057586.1 helix-turn-helix domain-containing protein [Anaerotignum propionicum]
MKTTKNWEDVPIIFDLAFAATLTGFSSERLRQLSRAGEFPARKIGIGNHAVWRIDKDEFVSWWESKKIQGVDKHAKYT